MSKKTSEGSKSRSQTPAETEEWLRKRRLRDKAAGSEQEKVARERELERVPGQKNTEKHRSKASTNTELTNLVTVIF